MTLTERNALRKLEADKEKLGRTIARQATRIEDLEAELEKRAKELSDNEIGQYRTEAVRHVKALQTIADGKGKYAKIARDAI